MISSNRSCLSVEEARSRIQDERYIIEEFIGEGGMACVYRAKESGTPNVYALKLLKEHFRLRDEFLEVFQIEATNMRDLQHPNIVRFYKFVVEDKSAYILMENIDGYPLTKYIQRARATEVPFPIDEAVRIMAQIARAINHLHNEGFIHRDIKPGNVLLRQIDGRAYLTDLGITGAQEQGFTLSGAGTPSYMPYEQQEAGLPIDHTVDIYAFAIMLFETLTGQKPFRAPSGIAYEEARRILIGLHQSAPVPNITEIRPELPEELNAIFSKALAKNPVDRYRNVMDFAQKIHNSLADRLASDLHDFESINMHLNARQFVEKSERTTQNRQWFGLRRFIGNFSRNKVQKRPKNQQTNLKKDLSISEIEVVNRVKNDYEITTHFNDYKKFTEDTVEAKSYDVFISYSRKDIQVMQRLTDFLRLNSLNVWTDERLEPGTPAWGNEIENAIRLSKTVVVLMSPDSKASEWVGIEIATANDFDVPIFPFHLRGNERIAIPFPLRNHQRIDGREDFDTAIKSLSLTIKRYLGTS